MQNPKSISELLKGRKRLSQLKVKTVARATVLHRVKSVLPQGLAESLASAGVEGEVLTLGVVSSAWASRMRYLSPAVRQALAASLGVVINKISVRVVPPIAKT